MKKLDKSSYDKYNVIAFSKGKYLGQWGFSSRAAATKFVTGMKENESFSGKFVVHIYSTVALYKSS